MIYVFALSVVAYPLLVGSWFFVDKARHRMKTVLGAVCILSAAPFFWFTGAFSSSFGDNMCYSAVVRQLGELPRRYTTGDASVLRQRFFADVESLPLHGYETSCNQVGASVERLLQAAPSVK